MGRGLRVIALVLKSGACLKKKGGGAIKRTETERSVSEVISLNNNANAFWVKRGKL